VYLEYQAPLQALRFQTSLDADHGQLDDVRRGALDGHIQRHSLAEGALHPVGVLQLRDLPAATHEGGHVAVRFGLLHDAFLVLSDAGVGGKVAVHIVLGLRTGDADVLGQGELGNAVNDAEIHRFCRRTHLFGDQFLRHAEDLGGGHGVDVRTRPEALQHHFVLGDVRQQAQLDLGVVGVHQHVAGAGDEHFAHLCPQGGADGDVL